MSIPATPEELAKKKKLKKWLSIAAVVVLSIWGLRAFCIGRAREASTSVATPVAVAQSLSPSRPYPEPAFMTIYSDRLVTNMINPGRYVSYGTVEVNGRQPRFIAAVDGQDPHLLPDSTFVDKGRGKTNVVFQLDPSEGKSATIAFLYRDQ